MWKKSGTIGLEHFLTCVEANMERYGWEKKNYSGQSTANRSLVDCISGRKEDAYLAIVKKCISWFTVDFKEIKPDVARLEFCGGKQDKYEYLREVASIMESKTISSSNIYVLAAGYYFWKQIIGKENKVTLDDMKAAYPLENSRTSLLKVVSIGNPVASGSAYGTPTTVRLVEYEDDSGFSLCSWANEDQYNNSCVIDGYWYHVKFSVKSYDVSRGQIKISTNLRRDFKEVYVNPITKSVIVPDCVDIVTAENLGSEFASIMSSRNIIQKIGRLSFISATMSNGQFIEDEWKQVVKLPDKKYFEKRKEVLETHRDISRVNSDIETIERWLQLSKPDCYPILRTADSKKDPCENLMIVITKKRKLEAEYLHKSRKLFLINNIEG